MQPWFGWCNLSKRDLTFKKPDLLLCSRPIFPIHSKRDLIMKRHTCHTLSYYLHFYGTIFAIYGKRSLILKKVASPALLLKPLSRSHHINSQLWLGLLSGGQLQTGVCRLKSGGWPFSSLKIIIIAKYTGLWSDPGRILFEDWFMRVTSWLKFPTTWSLSFNDRVKVWVPSKIGGATSPERISKAIGRRTRGAPSESHVTTAWKTSPVRRKARLALFTLQLN